MKRQQNGEQGRRPAMAALGSVVFGVCVVGVMVGVISGTGPLGHGPANAAASGDAGSAANGAPAAQSRPELQIAPASVDDPLDPRQINYIDVSG